MPQLSPPSTIDASSWSWYAQRVGIRSHEKLLLALSGGADSVFLLQLLAASHARPALLVLHVNHGLRAADSDADERFCQELCERLQVPFQCLRPSLGPRRGSLENQARKARYAALRKVAEASGHHTILTAHQAQDVLETLLWRWIRGSASAGLRGPARRMPLVPGTRGEALELVRPLLDLGREELRDQLRHAGMAWREDLSNLDERFTRNRIRQRLFPSLVAAAGPKLLEHLARYGAHIERVESHLEAITGELNWSEESCGRRSLPRASLSALPSGMQRRALWSLLKGPLGSGLRGVLLEHILRDLQLGQRTQHTLTGAWKLSLDAEFLHLDAPAAQPRR